MDNTAKIEELTTLLTQKQNEIRTKLDEEKNHGICTLFVSDVEQENNLKLDKVSTLASPMKETLKTPPKPIELKEIDQSATTQSSNPFIDDQTPIVGNNKASSPNKETEIVPFEKSPSEREKMIRKLLEMISKLSVDNTNQHLERRSIEDLSRGLNNVKENDGLERIHRDLSLILLDNLLGAKDEGIFEKHKTLWMDIDLTVQSLGNLLEHNIF